LFFVFSKVAAAVEIDGWLRNDVSHEFSLRDGVDRNKQKQKSLPPPSLWSSLKLIFYKEKPFLPVSFI
jgi:hypothetical protein